MNKQHFVKYDRPRMLVCCCIVLFMAACLCFSTAPAQEAKSGDSRPARAADSADNLRAAAGKYRADGYTKIASRIEELIMERRASEEALLAVVGGGERIAFDNQTDATTEGKQVFDGAVAGELALLANIGKAELFKVFDATTAPMRHNAGEPGIIEGAYSERALIGISRSIMLWGPYQSFEPGRYLVVYRFQFLDEAAGNKSCFLDVCHKAVTFSGRRPEAAAIPAHVWNEVAVPLGVPQNMPFEFRFWPEGKQVAVDRIYLYRLTDRTQTGLLRPISLMGAVERSGFYMLQNTNTSADSLFKLAGGPNGLAHSVQFTIWRQIGDEIQSIPLSDENARAEIAILPGDIVWVPERNATRILRGR